MTMLRNIQYQSLWFISGLSLRGEGRFTKVLITSSTSVHLPCAVLRERSQSSGFRLPSLQAFTTQRQCSKPCVLFLKLSELCGRRGGRPGLSVLLLTSLTVSVDVKQHWTVLWHWSQFVPKMSTDIRGHDALHHHHHDVIWLACHVSSVLLPWLTAI